LAIWEVTQSCDLACKHCRAAAQPIPSPNELTSAEGKALIDQIAGMHVPIFVMTGGDPLKSLLERSPGGKTFWDFRGLEERASGSESPEKG
jgi:organic radical activating enzyme